jgi:hypothetical protein
MDNAVLRFVVDVMTYRVARELAPLISGALRLA